ncbi:ribonuclease HI family protein [Agrilactobacillus yilanensis]|uniref:Ribonuclease HI family protein n=1 Tax=Agrilactobacillus yilanensis TaxID=2485997 RepID=A0ABW4JBD5_9LACO|nr:ribonuclease HI family protein [Agrilactobacillus yilanensis]
MIHLNTDAAVRGNPGPATAGILIVQDHQQLQLTANLGQLNNHEAEFAAAIWAFEYLSQTNQTHEIVAFQSDSRILIDSLNKRYSKSYSTYLAQLLALQAKFDLVLNQWVAESQNSGAHHLAIQALQKIKKPDSQ